MNPFSSALVRAGAKFLAPIVFLFAAYLTAAGLDGPGGGFAGGAAFTLGVVLYALVFGADAARAVCPAWLMRALMSLGVLGYIGLGAAGVARGYNFLDYQALLASTGPQTQRFGVSLAEYCALGATAGALVLIFYALAGRAGDVKDGAW